MGIDFCVSENSGAPGVGRTSGALIIMGTFWGCFGANVQLYGNYTFVVGR